LAIGAKKLARQEFLVQMIQRLSLAAAGNLLVILGCDMTSSLCIPQATVCGSQNGAFPLQTTVQRVSCSRSVLFHQPGWDDPAMRRK